MGSIRFLNSILMIKKYNNWLSWLWLILFFLAACDSMRTEELLSIPLPCRSNCETNYGVELGRSPADIAAYSNCNSNCVVFEPNHMVDVYTGIKWQCVEYARRWLLHEFEVVYGDVDIAADIWNLDQVTSPATGQSFKFDSIVNGSQSKPQRGDLLIYGKEYLGTGHVAVIVAINEEQSTLQLAEQNYLNSRWNLDFAREISYRQEADQFWLLDAYLIGWKRVTKN